MAKLLHVSEPPEPGAPAMDESQKELASVSDPANPQTTAERQAVAFPLEAESASQSDPAC